MLISELEKIISPAYVLTRAQDMAPYLTDWRGRYNGNACAVVKPASTLEVTQIVQLCQQHRMSLVPQGGNTSLCGASIPDNSGQQLVLNLTRLNRIRAIDITNQTITVEAGCILQEVQNAAASVQQFFPISLGAEGSCTIGGNLSTNAGGISVLRYGNMREQCLGLEVITANGEIWNGLRGLRKDNTGYDLRNLFIGAEGTLGIITAAVLKLTTRPQTQLTALLSLRDIHSAVSVLNLAKQYTDSLLSSFEFISNACMHLVASHFPQFSFPLLQSNAQIILIELSDYQDETHTREVLESFLTQAYNKDLIQNAVIAQSLAQSKHFWDLRHHIPLAQARSGKNIKHDIALPISHIATFFTNVEQTLKQRYPDCRIFAFGHIGDGNIHFNIAPPLHIKDTDFLSEEQTINHIVYQCVEQLNGTISAEHGIGQLKRQLLKAHKDIVEIELMRSIKQALDPYGIFNPGKVL